MLQGFSGSLRPLTSKRRNRSVSESGGEASPTTRLRRLSGGSSTVTLASTSSAQKSSTSVNLAQYRNRTGSFGSGRIGNSSGKRRNDSTATRSRHNSGSFAKPQDPSKINKESQKWRNHVLPVRHKYINIYIFNYINLTFNVNRQGLTNYYRLFNDFFFFSIVIEKCDFYSRTDDLCSYTELFSKIAFFEKLFFGRFFSTFYAISRRLRVTLKDDFFGKISLDESSSIESESPKTQRKLTFKKLFFLIEKASLKFATYFYIFESKI